MMKGFYYPHRNVKNPINNADIIYTPDVTVFKTDTGRPKLMNEAEWYDVDVITCAAPNLRERPSNRFNQGNGDRAVKVSDRELLEIHKKRLTRILDVAVLNGDEVVILGAFGCGAFQNKPEVVARAAKEAMADYLHAFKTIEFAVYCPPIDRTMKSGEIAQAMPKGNAEAPRQKDRFRTTLRKGRAAAPDHRRCNLQKRRESLR